MVDLEGVDPERMKQWAANTLPVKGIELFKPTKLEKQDCWDCPDESDCTRICK